MALDYDKAKENLAAHVAKITEQRNELLEALKRIADGPWPVEVDNPVAQCRFDEQIARAAIAKAEGK